MQNLIALWKIECTYCNLFFGRLKLLQVYVDGKFEPEPEAEPEAANWGVARNYNSYA